MPEEENLPKMTPMDHSKFGKLSNAPLASSPSEANMFLGFRLYDPYFWYLKLPNFSEYAKRLFLPSQGYSVYEKFGLLLGYTSVHETLPRRDQPYEKNSPDSSFYAIKYFRDEAYFPNRLISDTIEQHQVIPTLKVNGSDFFNVFTTTAFEDCHSLRIKAMECIEFHGLARANQICKDYMDDFHECKFSHFQNLRTNAIEQELGKKWFQYKAGKGEYPYKPVPEPHIHQDPRRRPWID